MTERQPTVDFRAMNHAMPEALDYTIQPNDALAGYVRDHLPNARARKDLQSQLDDNEHEISRYLRGHVA